MIDKFIILSLVKYVVLITKIVFVLVAISCLVASPISANAQYTPDDWWDFESIDRRTKTLCQKAEKIFKVT